jgi:hypothetical protein
MPRSHRLFAVGLAGVLLVACGNETAANPTGNEGSVRVASGHPPSGDAGQITFSGAFDGTSQATHESCESSGTAFRHFTLTATGDISGQQYFLSASIYPYVGPGTYELKALPQAPLDYMSTPTPLMEQAPSGYPGFLNFIPKSNPGNAYAGTPSTAATSAMAADSDEKSGWFDLRMVSVNQKSGTPKTLRVAGWFGCGQPFQI